MHRNIFSMPWKDIFSSFSFQLSLNVKERFSKCLFFPSDLKKLLLPFMFESCWDVCQSCFFCPFSISSCWVRCDHICTVIFSPMDAHLGINLDQIDGLDAQAWFSLIVLGLNEGHEWLTRWAQKTTSMCIQCVAGIFCRHMGNHSVGIILRIKSVFLF